MRFQQITLFVKQLGSKNPVFSHNRYLSVTIVRCLDQRWREKRGLPLNPNVHGVLTDGLDYTYLDGRPTPYGVNQKNRLEKQKQVAKKIIELTGEIDFAVARHKQMKLDEEQNLKNIINSKLKVKGEALLKK